MDVHFWGTKTSNDNNKSNNIPTTSSNVCIPCLQTTIVVQFYNLVYVILAVGIVQNSCIPPNILKLCFPSPRVGSATCILNWHVLGSSTQQAQKSTPNQFSHRTTQMLQIEWQLSNMVCQCNAYQMLKKWKAIVYTCIREQPSSRGPLLC